MLLAASVIVSVSVGTSAGVRIDARDLPEIRRIAERELASHGIEVRWEDGGASLPVAVTDGRDPRVPRTAAGVLGSAITEPGPGGARWIALYADRIRSLTRRAPRTYTRVFGRVLAHEIVHLVEGPGAHRHEGLMRPDWTARELSAPCESSAR